MEELSTPDISVPLVELDSAGVTDVLDESEELEEVSGLDDSELTGNDELELIDELEFSLEELEPVDELELSEELELIELDELELSDELELIELDELELVDELELSLDELELVLALSSKTTVSLAAEVVPSALIVIVLVCANSSTVSVNPSPGVVNSVIMYLPLFNSAGSVILPSLSVVKVLPSTCESGPVILNCTPLTPVVVSLMYF